MKHLAFTQSLPIMTVFVLPETLYKFKKVVSIGFSNKGNFLTNFFTYKVSCACLIIIPTESSLNKIATRVFHITLIKFLDCVNFLDFESYDRIEWFKILLGK